jgi:N-acetylglutamate synthase-like GNAT family acetyltransferase
MFADATLAARIDRAESRLTSDAAEAIRDAGLQKRVVIIPIAGGKAVYAGPSAPMNKLIGLGFDGALDLSVLDEVEREWCDRAEPVRVELSVLANPTLGEALTERGYRLRGFENVLGRSLKALEAVESKPELTVEVVRDCDTAMWMDIAVTSFMELDGTGSGPDDSTSREEMTRILSDFMVVPGYVRYLGRIEGQAVGEAAMRLDGGLAQVCGAGTLPAFRGRGMQKALLSRRLADAQAAGCDMAVVTTAPGSRSQDNVMRRGFELLYTRAVLVKKWD